MKHLSMDVRVPIELDNPAICRDEELCIKCGQCRDVCRDYIGVHGTYRLEEGYIFLGSCKKLKLFGSARSCASALRSKLCNNTADSCMSILAVVNGVL